MDHLAEHEAFLRAIFDAPDDDTPRLVYADFLEEHGDPERAAFVRVQCERKRLLSLDPGDPALVRMRELIPQQIHLQQLAAERHPELYSRFGVYDRGFRHLPPAVSLGPDELADVPGLRRSIVATHPEWFGCRALRVKRGRPLQSEHVEAVFALPALERVTEWDLGGHVEEGWADARTEEAGTFALIDLDVRPVITVAGVEALARHPAAKRITTLVLTSNNLDNDAARALVRSPHLINLRRLDLLEGNRLRGRTWQQLLERFGEGVVG